MRPAGGANEFATGGGAGSYHDDIRTVASFPEFEIVGEKYLPRKWVGQFWNYTTQPLRAEVWVICASPVEHLTVTPSGNVGIGTTSPVDLLHVQGDSVGGNSFNGRIKIGSHGYIRSEGYLPTWLSLGGEQWDSGIRFDVRKSDGTQLPGAVVIASDGNVGIGTTSPRAKLDVSQTAVIGAGPVSNAITVSQDGALELTGASNHLSIIKRGLASWPATPAAGDRWAVDNVGGTLGFWSSGSLQVIDGYKAVIQSNGNVGIGTTTPSAKLHVAGDIAVAPGSGVILKATNGPNCYRITVNNAGRLSTATVTCP